MLVASEAWRPHRWAIAQEQLRLLRLLLQCLVYLSCSGRRAWAATRPQEAQLLRPPKAPLLRAASGGGEARRARLERRSRLSQRAPSPTPFTVHSSPFICTLHHSPLILHVHPSPFTINPSTSSPTGKLINCKLTKCQQPSLANSQSPPLLSFSPFIFLTQKQISSSYKLTKLQQPSLAYNESPLS